MSVPESWRPKGGGEAPDGLQRASRGPQAAPANPSPFSGDELGHSRPIRWDRAAITESGKAAVSAILAQLEVTGGRKRARRPEDRRRLHGTLEAMLLDLYAAARADPTRFLAYPRNADDFNHGRYGNRLITLTAVRTVTAFLSAASLTEGAAGFFDRTPNDFGGPGERGRRTRVRATPALITLLEDAGLSIDAIGQKGTTETIRLKAAAMARRQTKQLIEYADTPETNSLRKSLASINALLTATQIELDGEAPSGPPEAPEEPDAEPLP